MASSVSSDPTIFSLRNLALKLNTADDLTPHIGPLTSSPTTITHIDLSGNTLGVATCEHISTLLPSLTNLRSANLADIFTGRLLAEIPPALDALLTALRKCEKLEEINLNDNAFGLNTVEPLRPFLANHVPLRHLYLNNNGLGPAAGTLVAQSLEQLAARKAEARKAGQQVPDLETIVCGRNRLEAGSMAAWAKAFSAHGKVKMVKMVQNGIRIEGIVTLLKDGLAKCTGLEVLDLQDNTFTLKAAKTLAQVLRSWPDLVELAVGDCLLSARGGVAVAEALGKGNNGKVEVLRLGFNEIDAKGLAALVKSAEGKALPRLRRVELNGNKFSEDDENIEALQNILSKRKEEGEETDAYPGLDHEDENSWGLDELDELEDEDSDDEDDAAEEDDEAEAEEASIVRDADLAEDEPVSQKKDEDVDELAAALGKAEIK
ncbi:Ran GAP Rna1 [Oleoguttula sp. CCFEE 5521]